MTTKLRRRQKIGLITAAIGGLGFAGSAQAVSITALNLSITQNFDSMGTTATNTTASTAPTDWLVLGATNSSPTNYSSGSSSVPIAYGTSGTGVITGTSSGGFVNFASGAMTTATDRSLGILNTSSFTTGKTIEVKFTNDTGSTITSLDLAWAYEKYRSGSRAQTWNFFTGSDGTAWTAAASGDQAYAADAANTTVLNPPTSIAKSFTLSGLNISAGASLYLRWTLTGTGGSTNGQALAIDDFGITAHGTTNTVHILTWNAAASTTWDVGTAANFTDGTNTTTYAQGDQVTFAELPPAGGAVAITAGGVAPSSLAFTNTTGTYTVTGGGISGATNLVKSGAGTVQLNNTNSFSGGVNITGGTLTFGSGNNNALASTGAVGLNGGILDLAGTNQSVGAVTLTSGQIIGSGTLTGTSYTATAGTISASLGGVSSNFTKTGSGTVVLTGTHSYSGTTTIAAGGTLNVNATLTNSAVTVGGVLDIGGAATAGSLAAAALTFSAGSTLTFDATLDSISLGAGALTVNGGTINFGALGSAGSTYTLFSTSTTPTVNTAFTVGTKPAGVGQITFGYASGLYTATFNAQVQGVGSNPGSFASSSAGYQQNFNSLASSGTANSSTTLPQGVSFVKVTSQTTTYRAGTGSDSTGDVYSLGVASTPAAQANSADRAFGSLNSNATGNIYLGVNLKNDTGAPMTQLVVSYRGMQFRSGGSGNVDGFKFEYSTDATSLDQTTGATWTEIASLDFVSLVTGTSQVAVDPTVNFTDLTGSVDLTGTPIAIGNGFWLRWTDTNIGGNDDLIGIDNLNVTPEPTSLGLIGLGATGMLARRRRRAMAVVA